MAVGKRKGILQTLVETAWEKDNMNYIVEHRNGQKVRSW